MRRIQIIIGAVIGFLLLLWILQRIDLGELAQVLSRANYLYILPAAVILLFSFWVRALRWREILRPVKELDLPTLFSGQLIGYLVNALLFTNAGELVRIYTIGRNSLVSKSSLLATVVVERMLDVVAVLLLLLPILILLPATESITQIEILVAVIFGGMWIGIFIIAYQRERAVILLSRIVLRFPRGLGSKIARRLSLFLDGLKILLQGGQMMKSILYSLLVWGLTALSWFILGQSLGLPLVPYGYALPVGVTFLASALPALPARLGTFEFLVVWTLGLLGVGNNEALALAILVRLYRLLPLAVGYAFLLREGISWSDLRAGGPPDSVPAA